MSSIVMSRVSQQAARYTPLGSNAESCGRCRFYMAPSSCGRIVGPVSPRGWCKYYSREMVQAYGGSIIAFGTQIPSGASLDLSFMTPGTLDPSITFTRASTATYTDFNGVIQTAAVNAPRWDYSGGALNGLLIEEARTNLTVPSTNWGTTHPPSNSVDGITWNVGISPSGGNDAMSLIPGMFNSVHQFFVIFGGAVNTTYTYSVYVKPMGLPHLYMELANSGFDPNSQGAVFDLINGVVITQSPNGSAQIHRCANGWFRCSVTATSNATGGAYVSNLRPTYTDDNPGFTGNGTDAAWVWGNQVEAGAFATSYIPTTAAAVTRAFDNCVMPSGAMGWFVPPGGSWFGEFISFIQSSPTSPRFIAYSTGGTISPLFINGSGEMGQYDGSNGMQTANTVVVGAVSKAVSAFASPTTSQICLNAGVPVTSAALSSGYAALASSGFLFMGNGVTGENISGYLRRFSYWPRVLSNAEMQQVTT